MLCDSRGSRMCSFIKGFFYHGYELNESNIKFREKYNEYYVDMNKCENEYGNRFYKNGDDYKLKEFIDGFVENLDKVDDSLFYWFFKIYYFEGKVGNRNRRRKSMFVLVDIIGDYIEKSGIDNLKKLKNICFKWIIENNNSRNEGWLWLVCLIKFYFMRNEINWEEEVNYDLELNNDEVEKLYNINLSGRKIEVDDYCIDIHVYEGKLKGKNEKDFVLEGSVIVNENIEILNKLYKEVYNYRKMN